jgi:hypothetical protein
VGGHSSSGTTADDDTSSTSMNGGSRTNSPPIPASNSHQGSGSSCALGLSYAHEGGRVGSVIQHAGSAFEGGSKVAFDPRDLAQDAGEEARIGGKMPRLTIMEEVLLLGIKDKQVSCIRPFLSPFKSHNCRATYPSGTTTYPTPSEAASSSSSPSADASPSSETPTGVASPWRSG